MGVIPVFNVYDWREEYMPDTKIFGRRFPTYGYVVYFIQAGDGYDGPIKIGLAKDLGLRFEALQCGHFEELYIRLICCSVNLLDYPPARKLEQRFHSLFASLHIRGEWFKAEGDLLAFIEDPARCLHLFHGYEGLAPARMLELIRQGVVFD